MPNIQTPKIWFYLSILPNFVVLLGLTLVFLASTYQWGIANEIPVSMLLALFFSEFSMVIAGLGFVGFIKTRPKSRGVTFIGIWNVLLLITACVIGYNIFMTL
ncbi:MAG: hypothetical protein OQK46_10345 [Gammaproteobacteria bacterium]|nr:hypothetical protein [Gammaproteobacteria bacterium]